MTKITIGGRETNLNAQQVRESLNRIASDMDAFLSGATEVLELRPKTPFSVRLTPPAQTGYLAPGVDPDTIPPHILPYVFGIDFDNLFGKLAPGTDPSTIPPHILPYVRYISRRNMEIEALRDALGHAQTERDNLRHLTYGLLTNNVELSPGE